MAKVHDKYVVELAEIIKGYGNDPDINDPFCLSEFYRFYEVPNVCVSAENFKKMRPLSDYTEEIEPESISEWKKEFREYVDSLDIARDDWKGIIEYIDELPSIQPDTTIYDSNVVKKGINDGDRTSGDCINRQQAINKIKPWLEVKGYSWGELNMLRAVINELENMPSAQPETRCSEIPNNSETISRQQAIDALCNYLVEKRCPDDGTLTCRLIENEVINKLPSAQPERKKGHWIPVTNGRGGHKCDRCGSYAPSYQSGTEWLSNFCPECNADMRGERNE